MSGPFPTLCKALLGQGNNCPKTFLRAPIPLLLQEVRLAVRFVDSESSEHIVGAAREPPVTWRAKCRSPGQKKL